MSELKYVGDKKLCKTCRYSCNNGAQVIVCGYLDIVKHSRTIENGKKRIPDYYCDKYMERGNDSGKDTNTESEAV